MHQSKAPMLLLVFFGLLALFVTTASIAILSGGKLYHKIPAKSRPRRWFVAIWFSYFVSFCFWSSTSYFYPSSIISRVFSVAFGGFTAFIAAWYALGRIGGILLPIITLVERIIDVYSNRSGRTR
jgi:hypothetical protein